jgi:hypothetical protein
MDINGIYLNASQPTQSVHNIRSIFKLWTVCFHSIYSIPLISVPGNKAPGSSLGFTPTPNHPEIKTGLCASVITNYEMYENVWKCHFLVRPKTFPIETMLYHLHQIYHRSHLSNLSTLMYFMTSGCQGQEIWRPLLRLASNQHVRNSALRADIGHSAHPGRNREYTRRTSPPWTLPRTKSGLEPSGSKGLRVHNTSRNGKCRDWPLKSAFGSKLSLANACLNQA